MFILFNTDKKTYFESGEEFVTALRTIDAETCGRFEQLHWNGKYCLVLQTNALHMRREENQLDVTECFIALTIRSTCFGHFYAHHQELETICVLIIKFQLNAQYFISITMLLYMFPATLRPSSGGPLYI